MQRVDALIAEALAIRELKGTVLDATDIGTHAIEYAVNNWAVFPLNGPAIAGGRGVSTPPPTSTRSRSGGAVDTPVATSVQGCPSR